MTLRVVTAVLFGMLTTSFAQPSTPSLRFEVASVKPNDPSNVNFGMLRGGPGTSDPGRLSGVNVNLWKLIVRAWDLKLHLWHYLLVAPDWIASWNHSGYDIDARIPAGSSGEQVNLMLQNLLAERFGLTVHWETRELPVYELTVAKGGLKMKTAESASGKTQPPAPAGERPPLDGDLCPMLPPGIAQVASWPVGRNECMTGRMQPVSRLLQLFEGQLQRAVVDRTGLSGTCDFRLRFVPAGMEEGNIAGTVGDVNANALNTELAAAASEPGESLIAAAQRQLGLKLQAARAPVKVLVVDKANQTPTEN